MKNLFDKHKVTLIILIIILACVSPMVIIHFLFKWKSGIQWIIAEWTSGEVLDYFGSILGGIFTIFGVWYTVKASNKQYIEEQKNSVKPYLSFLYNDYTDGISQRPQKCLTVYACGEIFYDDYSDMDYFRFYGMSKTITTFYNGIVLYSYYFNESSEEKYLVFEIRFKNVGKGLAKSLAVECNEAISFKSDLRVEEEMLIALYLHDNRPDDLNLKIKYENLFDDEFEINIFFNKTDKGHGYLPEIKRN